jgi:hypothetical protein
MAGAEDHAENALTDTHTVTYRYLRAGMGVLVLMLGIAVVGERLTATCWQSSISAYYFTAAHGIFIAALCGLGIQFIVYKGNSDSEDVLLNLAGVLAFVVAMVPTARPMLLCGPSDLPPDYTVNAGITNNVWAVVGSLVVAQALLWWSYKKSPNRRRPSALGIAALVIFWAVLLLGLAAFIFLRDQFNSYAHGASASIMFLAIIATVSGTAFLANRQDADKSPHKRGYVLFYRAIAVGMLVTLVLVIVLHFALDAWNHWVIVIETLLIAEFTAYWVAQTVELWAVRDRIALLTPKDQQQLAVATPAADQAPQPDLAANVHAKKISRGDKILRAL